MRVEIPQELQVFNLRGWPVRFSSGGYNARIALGVDDTERADRALKGIVGKGLTYRGSPEGPLTV